MKKEWEIKVKIEHPEVKNEKSIDKYLSDSFDLILSHPKILLPFFPAAIVNLIYLIYIFKRLFVYGIFSFATNPEAIEFFASESFIFVTVIVIVITVFSYLIGSLSVAYFAIKEQDYMNSFKVGVSRAPFLFGNFIAMLLVFVLAFLPIMLVKSPFLVLGYVFILSFLVTPLFLFLPAIVLDHKFAIIESLKVYRANLKKSIILGILYVLVSSAVSSLIPIIGSLLNYLIVIPAFTVVYALVYKEQRRES